ncbi:MAG: hypothetical protein KC418_03205 [Anaerolineales bacterium]|nr:hypothetical protein [Anaerolineales bacterium]MCB8952822.1 hypothetical protein [Ardenticatenales bacterium]
MARKQRNVSHMPGDSTFYEKVVPALLVGLGIIMVILIVVAAGILLGLIPFQ